MSYYSAEYKFIFEPCFINFSPIELHQKTL